MAGFRRRHVGTSIQEAWTTSLEGIRAALDADPSADFEERAIGSATEESPKACAQLLLSKLPPAHATNRHDRRYR